MSHCMTGESSLTAGSLSTYGLHRVKESAKDRALRTEEELLDKVTAVLEEKEHRKGLHPRDIADKIGVAIGVVEQLLRSSECIIRRSRKDPRLWVVDWRECSSGFRPKDRLVKNRLVA